MADVNAYQLPFKRIVDKHVACAFHHRINFLYSRFFCGGDAQSVGFHCKSEHDVGLFTFDNRAVFLFERKHFQRICAAVAVSHRYKINTERLDFFAINVVKAHNRHFAPRVLQRTNEFFAESKHVLRRNAYKHDFFAECGFFRLVPLIGIGQSRAFGLLFGLFCGCGFRRLTGYGCGNFGHIRRRGIFRLAFMHFAGAALNYSVVVQHFAYRSEKAFTIESETKLMDVFAVQACLFGNFQLVSAVNLRPTGKSRANVVCSVFIAFFDEIVLVPKCRARSYYRHLSNENIEKLRKLVYTRPAHKALPTA